MRRRDTNQPDGEFEADHYSLLERLPPRFRRLLQYANINLQAGWVHGLLASHSEDYAYSLARAIIRQLRRETVIEAYGVQHPQARV